ncbi:PEP-CTERM sorting domain-containing protein [Geopsychrobacter electrodiphilus]|uniref:PEP-CTERM sorting domain-containing protein n=1 Tax=Geopsychrobacter electrodiphilus TaxID=225196 RepID=UPI00039B96C6|nr:PEP-CTERM sorting domain-containing protein [Geopsychrobacter electrodiphilus]
MSRKVLLLGIIFLLTVCSNVFASDYYEFSTFGGPGSEYDVGSYGNDIYYGGGSSVYKTTVSITDMAKANEPKFLADGVTPNPNYQVRTFTSPTYINLSGAPTSLEQGSWGEMYIDANNIYTAGYTSYSSTGNYGAIYSFDKATGAYNGTAVTGGGAITSDYWGIGATLLSYGGGQWWAANESSKVYSSTGGAWTYEFTWPSMGGGHGDGMEYVNGNIWVSDMTSNFIARWGKVGDVWMELNRFAYTEAGGNKYVEGMGFGALGHFWAGSGSQIYELGGGVLGDYTETVVPEPSTYLLLGIGLIGLFLSRKRIQQG